MCFEECQQERKEETKEETQGGDQRIRPKEEAQGGQGGGKLGGEEGYNQGDNPKAKAISETTIPMVKTKKKRIFGLIGEPLKCETCLLLKVYSANGKNEKIELF